MNLVAKAKMQRCSKVENGETEMREGDYRDEMMSRGLSMDTCGAIGTWMH
jgi:hypothetical protein